MIDIMINNSGKRASVAELQAEIDLINRAYEEEPNDRPPLGPARTAYDKRRLLECLDKGMTRSKIALELRLSSNVVQQQIYRFGYTKKAQYLYKKIGRPVNTFNTIPINNK